MAGREAQLARRLLLKSRGRERRRRIARQRPRFHRRDSEAPGFDRGLGGVRRAPVADAEAVDLLAAEAGQARRELGAVRLRGGGDAPIFLRLEQLDLAFAIDDQPQRNGLNAAGGFCPG